MAVTGVSSQFPSNHVSHSFAQYVAFDGGLPVYADHSDAYPRAFVLNVEDAQGQSAEHVVLPFSGAIGDNTTNAIPGGLGVSAVKLVQLNNNTFVVMWQTEKVVAGQFFHGFGDFRYAVFDGTGKQIGQTTTVDSRGNVTAVGAGTTTITASCTVNGQSCTASCTVTVTATQGDVSIAMAPSSLSLTVGQRGSVTAAVTGTSSSPSISYTSGNRNVATVDSSGSKPTVTITAKNPGRACITCQVTLPNGTRSEALCYIVVYPN